MPDPRLLCQIDDLDPGIASFVEVLRHHGIETFESCEGGEGHSFREPTIRFDGTAANGYRAVWVALTFGPLRRCCTARSKSLTSLMPVAESPGAVRIGHPERGHLVEYLAPNSVFNSLPRQRSCSHLRPDDRFVTIDRVLHHASLGEA